MLSLANQDDSLYKHFCDAVIRVDGVEINVHKIILCKLCVYFEALFLRHSAPETKYFEISGLSADMMRCIIEFAYKGSVHVTEDNVEQLLQAADQFNVVGIVKVCCNFLVEKLSTENCIHIWQFTDTFCCPELRHEAHRFILNRFEEVVSSEQFQQLSVQEFTHILGRDELNVSQESIVYEAVLKWIDHAPEERKRHFAVLLSKVRLALTRKEYVRRVRFSALVEGDKKCLKMAKYAFRLKCSMDRIRPKLSSCSNPIARPRLPNAILFAFGGWSNGPTNVAEVYDIRSDSWFNVTDYQERPRVYHGTVFYRGSVYCVGGFEGDDSSDNSVRRFDLKTHTWHEVAPMHHRRCFVSVTVLNGYIYAMGGREGERRHTSVERYNPKTNQWSLMASMLEERSDAQCAVLHNKIYVCGGYDGQNCLDTCEYYCPETDRWTSFANMDTQRSGLGVLAYGGQIFAVGGFDGHSRLSSVEVYSPLTDTWHAKSSMLAARSNFGTAVIDNKLFAVGGYNDGITNCVEYYDTSTGRWSEARKMRIFRSGMTCAAVSGLPNIEDYVICRDTLLRLD